MCSSTTLAAALSFTIGSRPRAAASVPSAIYSDCRFRPTPARFCTPCARKNKRFLRVWNRKTGTGVTAYEGIDPGTYQHWATDSSAFTLPTFASQDVPAGVLAAQVTGENATFVPAREGAFGFTSPNNLPGANRERRARSLEARGHPGCRAASQRVRRRTRRGLRRAV